MFIHTQSIQAETAYRQERIKRDFGRATAPAAPGAGPEARAAARAPGPATHCTPHDRRQPPSPTG